MEEDTILHKKFSELHVELVNKIILFCKENNVKCDIFRLSGDCLMPSIEFGSWHPATDSTFELVKTDEKTNEIKSVLFSA